MGKKIGGGSICEKGRVVGYNLKQDLNSPIQASVSSSFLHFSYNQSWTLVVPRSTSDCRKSEEKKKKHMRGSGSSNIVQVGTKMCLLKCVLQKKN